MKIGIVIYSQTGNTMSVAQKIQKALTDKGHDAVIERIIAEKLESNAQARMTITYAPKLSGYDMLIFGAPVQAFALCAVMKRYLTEKAEKSSAEYSSFVTQQFKYSWLGGNNAIKKIKSLLSDKEMTCKNSAIIHWSAPDRESEIDAAVRTLSEV